MQDRGDLVAINPITPIGSTASACRGASILLCCFCMLPKVVIVGRPNVGKSSILNLLARRRVSIVDPTAGVTRDRVSTTVRLAAAEAGQPEPCIELVDTGGYGIQDTQDLTAQVQQQIAFALAEANLVLFVVDAQAGIMPLDEQVARLLRKTGPQGPPTLLVVNKVDGPELEAEAHQMRRLGFGEPLAVSATSGYRRNLLAEAIRDAVDFETLGPEEGRPDDASSPMLLAIVGKRNAGKSTLVNALAGEQRVIVSELEGTTRDSVDVRIELNGRVFIAIDTAGVRKRKSIKSDIEFYSHHRALRSVRRADVVMLLIDATVPVSQVDRKLAHEIAEHYKPSIVVVNKWDLVEDQTTREAFASYLDDTLGKIDFSPIAFTSATRGEGLRELVAMGLNLYEQAGHRVSTGELNRIVQQILADRTPTSSVGRRPRVYYVTQLAVHPPTIGLFVNSPEMFDPSYERFLLNRFRDELPFSEVPIKLLVRGKKAMPRGAGA